jgi:hypothetical protein
MKPESSEAKLAANITHKAQQAYQRLWQYFPASFGPDPIRLPNPGNIRFGSATQLEFEMHPQLRPEIRRLSDQKIQESQADFQTSKGASYDGTTYTFHPHILLFGDQYVTAVVYHEVAGMTQMSNGFEPPDWQDEFIRNRIQDILDSAFVDSYKPDRNQVQFQRLGFRKLLFLDGYAVSDVIPGDVFDVFNEMFEICFEHLSMEAMKRDGNLRELDVAIEKGLTPTHFVDTPKTYKAFFDLCRAMPWAAFLDVLASGDVLKLQEKLRPHLGLYTDEWLGYLIESVREDEMFVRTTAQNMGAKRKRRHR